MLLASLVIAVVLTSFAAVHAACALVALRWSGRSVPVSLNGQAPRVAVVLAVRGCDPSLAETVRGLLEQEYGPYEVHIVVDHRTDPAWELIRSTLAQHDAERRAHMHELQSPPETCGLKCAALVQAIRSLAGVDVVATIDADVVPHGQWLSTLVAPLEDPSVGIATGNHWFTAEQANAGTLLRSLWNAGALVPTAVFGNPWAGTAAMRLEDVHKSGLLDRWLCSVVDDGPVRQAYAELGKRIRFCPQLIMLNREPCTLQYFLRYIKRILTWSRVYERSFWFTVAHVVVNLTPWMGGVVCLLASLAVGNMPAASLAAVGLAGHALLLWSAYLAVRTGVARVVAARGERLPRLTVRVALQSLALTPVALLMHGYAVLRAIAAREVTWRGIRYRVRGPGQVVMTGYRPLAPESESAMSI